MTYPKFPKMAGDDNFKEKSSNPPQGSYLPSETHLYPDPPVGDETVEHVSKTNHKASILFWIFSIWHLGAIAYFQYLFLVLLPPMIDTFQKVSDLTKDLPKDSQISSPTMLQALLYLSIPMLLGIAYLDYRLLKRLNKQSTKLPLILVGILLGLIAPYILRQALLDMLTSSLSTPLMH